MITIDKNILNLLFMSKNLRHDHLLWSDWLRVVASAIYLEQCFEDEFKSCGKEISSNLNGLDEIPTFYWDRYDALRWCSDTYDVRHPLRNNVETIDSIEEVRQFLKSLDRGVSLLNLVEHVYSKGIF
jgi:hypothetical protein